MFLDHLCIMAALLAAVPQTVCIRCFTPTVTGGHYSETTAEAAEEDCGVASPGFHAQLSKHLDKPLRAVCSIDYNKRGTFGAAAAFLPRCFFLPEELVKELPEGCGKVERDRGPQGSGFSSFKCWCSSDNCNTYKWSKEQADELTKRPAETVDELMEVEQATQEITMEQFAIRGTRCFNGEHDGRMIKDCKEGETFCVVHLRKSTRRSGEVSMRKRGCAKLSPAKAQALFRHKKVGFIPGYIFRCEEGIDGIACYCNGIMCNDAHYAVKAAEGMDSEEQTAQSTSSSSESSELSEPKMTLSTNRLTLPFSNVKEFVHISNAGDVPIAYKVETDDPNLVFLNHCGVIQPAQQASVCMWSPSCVGLSTAQAWVKGVEAPGGVYDESLFRSTDRIVLIETFHVSY